MADICVISSLHCNIETSTWLLDNTELFRNNNVIFCSINPAYVRELFTCNSTVSEIINVTTDWKYIVTSVQHPIGYRPNLECLWQFQTDPDGLILCTVDFMMLDLLRDSVIFGDGIVTNGSAMVIYNTTWGSKLLWVKSLSNSLWVRFQSDGVRQMPGFRLILTRLHQGEEGKTLPFSCGNT